MRAAQITRIVIFSIIALFFIGVLIFAFKNDFGLNVFRGENSNYSTENTYSHETDGITGLNIDWYSGKVEINYTDGSQIQIKEYSSTQLDDHNIMRMDVNKDTLNITWDDKNLWFGWLFNNRSKKLVIEIPRGLTFESIVVKGTSCDIDIDELTAESFNLKSVSGNISLSNITSYDISVKSTSGNISCNSVNTDIVDIKSTTGDVNINDSSCSQLGVSLTSGTADLVGGFQDITVKAISGNASVHTTALIRNAVIESVSGNLRLTVPEDTSANIEHNSVSGKFSSALPSVTNSNSSDSNIKLSTTSGNINVGVGGNSVKLEQIVIE